MPLICVLLALLTLLTGCWSHQPAHPRAGAVEPVAPLAAAVWPARDTEQVRVIMEQTPAEFIEVKLRPGVDECSLHEIEKGMLGPTYLVKYKGVHARNLLRIYEKPKHESALGTASFSFLFMGFEPNGFLMSSRTLEAGKARRELETKLNPKSAAPLHFVSTDDEKLTRIDISHLHLEDGLPVFIPPPTAAPVKGLVIHLQSLGANEYEPKVLEEFRRRGWAVIDIKPQSYIRSPIPEAWHAEIRDLAVEYKQLQDEIYAAGSGPAKVAAAIKNRKNHPKFARFDEVEKRQGKLRRGGFQVCNDADLSKVAGEIAWEIDQGMAGAAYGVESVLDYVDTQRPDLQNVPTVIMGFSAGALATPTATARMEAVKPGRISAVVVIAGGCNLLKIARESSFSDGGLRVLCGEQPVDKPTGSQLDDLYLAASKLDPYHTAPLIAHLPVLQVHAGKDTWVPKATGELLYERLNCPERLVLSGDHDILFYLLPQKSKWIADWVEREVHPARAQSDQAASEHAAH